MILLLILIRFFDNPAGQTEYNLILILTFDFAHLDPNVFYLTACFYEKTIKTSSLKNYLMLRNVL